MYKRKVSDGYEFNFVFFYYYRKKKEVILRSKMKNIL